MMANTKDMTRGNPAKLIVTFALPLMLGNVFQQLYTIVDAMVVGNVLGAGALAAVGVADWPSWTMLGLATGFAQGFSVPMTQSFGGGNHDALRREVSMAVILSATLALLLTGIGLSIATPVLRLLNTPDDIMGDARTYLIICLCGIVPIMFYNLQAAILRALGNSKTPFIAMIVAAIANIVLDILFVAVLHWGVAGAAIATVLAQCLSGLFCFMVIKRIPILRLRREDWRFDRKIAASLLKMGLPTAFQNGIIGVGGVVVQNVVNKFGVAFIAGFTATNKLYGLLELAATSFGFSIVTYTGQNLGAGKIDRIRKGVRISAIISIAISMVITLVMLLFGQGIVGSFINDTPEVKARAVSVAYEYLKIMSIMLPILYLLYVYRSALMGLGDAMTPMVSGIVEFAMRLLVISLLPGIMGERGAYFAEVAAWTGATVILATVYYYRQRKLMSMERQTGE